MPVKKTSSIAKEAIMSKKKVLRDINLQNVEPCTEVFDNYTLAIFDHLTPKKQELLKQTKSIQKENRFAFYWVKNNSILMRESMQRRIIKINNLADLDRVKSTAGNLWMFPSPNPFLSRGRGSRGRISNRGSRVGTRSTNYHV